jgi:hypothetical protein
VLDYSSQQYLLFPQLALSFAMHFASEAGSLSYDHYIEKFRANDFKGLPEMHVLTSTLKVIKCASCFLRTLHTSIHRPSSPFLSPWLYFHTDFHPILKKMNQARRTSAKSFQHQLPLRRLCLPFWLRTVWSSAARA